jgi:hypothetical protein
MTTLTLTPEIEAVARRVIWFEEPPTAIANTSRFLAYAMTYGTHRDVAEIRKQLSDDELRAALAAAPPGIFDPRSWAYWHLMLDQYPPPPLPERVPLSNTSADPPDC